MSHSRRLFLRQALLGSGGLGLRSFVTGLAPAFLARGAMASTGDGPTFLLQSVSGDGEAWNCNGPGSYPTSSDPNDPVALYAQHPAAWATPTLTSVGGVPHLVGPPWADPTIADPGMLDQLALLTHATHSNAHPEFDGLVRTINRTCVNAAGAVSMFSTVLAEELATPLGTLTRVPLPLGAEVPSLNGASLPKLAPSQLPALFPDQGGSRGDLLRLRDATIDQIYGTLQSQGTPAQRAYFDKYVISREALRALETDLAPYLSGIGVLPDGSPRAAEDIDDEEDQVEAAIAMLKLRVAPVINIHLTASGDNHEDPNSYAELTRTPRALTTLSDIWNRLTTETDHYGVPFSESVTFATEDCFGRTLKFNESSGRDHNGQATMAVMFGPRVQPGVYGGLEAAFVGSTFDRFESLPIDPATGAGTATGSIPPTASLPSLAKTIATAVGVDPTIVEARITAGEVITGMLR